MIMTESASKKLSTLTHNLDKEMFIHISNSMNNSTQFKHLQFINDSTLKLFNAMDDIIDFSFQKNETAISFFNEWDYLNNSFKIEMEDGEVKEFNDYDTFYSTMIEPHLDVIPSDEEDDEIFYTEDDIEILKSLLSNYITAIDNESEFANSLDSYMKKLHADNQIMSLISDRVIIANERLIDILLNTSDASDWLVYWMYESRADSSTKERKAVITIDETEISFTTFDEFFDSVIRPLLKVEGN
jgi:hypothetical protein